MTASNEKRSAAFPEEECLEIRCHKTNCAFRIRVFLVIREHYRQDEV